MGLMKRKIFLFLFAFVFTLLLGNFNPTLACSCREISSCEAYNFADAVFVGKVIGSKEQITVEDRSEYYASANTATPAEPRKITYDVGEIYFEVTESFLGTEKGSRVAIRSGKGGGDCSFWFKRGETYLVYARKGNSFSYVDGDKSEKLETSICSRTQLFSGAKEDLEYLRNLEKNQKTGLIFGAFREVFNYRKNEETKPFGKFPLKFRQIDNEEKTFETVVDSTGKYEIKVPAGRYEIIPVFPEYAQIRELGSYKTEIEVQANGCAKADFIAENKAKISGKLISSDGKPLKDLDVELINSATKEWTTSATTDSEGNFSLEGIPAGKYLIAVNKEISPHAESPYPTFYYPKAYNRASAKIFEIGLGENIDNLVFQLPPKLKEQEIRGIVVWANGKPAVKTRVEIDDIIDDSFFRAERITETDASGKFVLKGFVGRSYTLKAKFEKYEDLLESEAKKEMLETGKITMITSADNPPRYVRVTRGEAEIKPFMVTNKPLIFKIVLKEE